MGRPHCIQHIGINLPWQLEDLGVEFGVNSGSIFNIDPGLTIGVALISLTSRGHTALIEISSPSGWQVSWDYPTSPSGIFI